jgi:hypothetical protein
LVTTLNVILSNENFGKRKQTLKRKKKQDDDKPFKNKDLMYKRGEDDNMQGIPRDKTIIDILT